jgi:hypothetical protein
VHAAFQEDVGLAVVYPHVGGQAGHWRACVGLAVSCVEPMLASYRLIRLHPEVHAIDAVFVCCWLCARWVLLLDLVWLLHV